MDPVTFFLQPKATFHRQYEALRAYYLENKTAQEVATQFRYTHQSFYSLTREFKKELLSGPPEQIFFRLPTLGRRPKDKEGTLGHEIVTLRKQNFSIADIKATLDAKQWKISERYVYNVLKKEGFARLPRRNQNERTKKVMIPNLQAPKTVELSWDAEEFTCQNSLGLLCFLPYIQKLGLHHLIEQSTYPGTRSINKLQSILCFLVLKLSNIRRYTADDSWCMDRGIGLFPGLNVLPKSAWFTSYSHGITRQMNLNFLKKLGSLWRQQGLLSDTANLDFVAVPYWGDDDHLENNWSGTRHKALSSILAALSHDPDSGIITYGDASVRHDNESKVVVEFLDFYKSVGNGDLKYLVFDSKFTTYQNLKKLDEQSIKFLTIRRRGKTIVSQLEKLPKANWKSTRVSMANGRTRLLKVNDTKVFLKEYGQEIRQVAITGHGKLKPALIITNDFALSTDAIIRKYARRWLVEKAISEQTHFFHLNRVSSSMVIKVDFDLTMTILAHNLYRVFASHLTGYTHNAAVTLYEKFIQNSGSVSLSEQGIIVKIKKKRNLPLLLTVMAPFQKTKISWLNNMPIQFVAATHT